MVVSPNSFFLVVVVVFAITVGGQIPEHLPIVVRNKLNDQLSNDAVSYNLAKLVFFPKDNDTFVDCEKKFGEFNPLLVDLLLANWTTLYMSPRNDRAQRCIEKIYANSFYYYSTMDSDDLLPVDQVLYIESVSDLPAWSPNIRTSFVGGDNETTIR